MDPKDQRIAELEAQLAEKNLIPGVPAGLEADVRRRMALAPSLSLPHAIQAARNQAAHDKWLAEQAAAEAKAKTDTAKAETNQLAALNKRITELEAKLAAKT